MVAKSNSSASITEEVLKANVHFISEQAGERCKANTSNISVTIPLPSPILNRENKKKNSAKSFSMKKIVGEEASKLRGAEEDTYRSNMLTPSSTEIKRQFRVRSARKKCLESENNWTIPDASPRRFDCSDVLIKTEEDSFDIDVQATDLSALNDPYEEINNNFNERDENSASSSAKFYSCDNNVSNEDSAIDYRERLPDTTSPTIFNNTYDTCNIGKSIVVLRKTVNDLIGQTDDSFYCRYCRKSFRRESSVKQHSLTHINSIKHPFKCMDCPSSFQKCSEYVSHKSVHLLSSATITVAAAAANSLCNLAPLIQLDSPPHFVVTPVITESSETEHGVFRTCFKAVSNDTHQENTTNELPSQKCCSYCPMNFSDSMSYRLHLRNNHNIWQQVGSDKNMCSKSTSCSKCDRQFSSRKTLIRHEKFAHSQKPNNNTCMICGRTFLKLSYLKSHSRAHQGLFPFRCLQCDQGFRKQAKLYTHIKSHEKL